MNTHWKHSLATMWQFEKARISARVQRFCSRISTPRQAASSALVIGFIALYLIAGVTVFSRRDPVDPARLQTWLSGGMVLYAVYHAIKYLWAARPVDSPTCVHTTPAMSLWLSGSPLPRAAILLHEVARVIPATAIKSMLLCVVLWGDAPSLLSFGIGIFLAMLTLECVRRVVSHVVDAMGKREKTVLKLTSLIVGIALAAQLGLQTINETPAGSDPAEYMTGAIAEVALFASSDVVQSMAFPLQPASHLAVSRPMWPLDLVVPATWIPLHAVLLLFLSLAVIVSLAIGLIRFDAWAIDRRHAEERRQLPRHQHNVQHGLKKTTANRRAANPRMSGIAPSALKAIVTRQWLCVGRYRWNVLLSFAIPMVVSLSPLFTQTEGLAGNAVKQWVFVIGGIALSSLLLAPPALQIDFRRDLKRMGMLKSFPVTSRTMCAGMLSIPVIITIVFQWSTLAIATIIATPPAVQVVWLALVFPALAVLTFAIENALFLAFPHQIHDQGIAMVIRAKVTFLWKGLVLALVPVCLFFWISICHALLPAPTVLTVAFLGSLLGCWLVALVAFAALVGCWRRFDSALDTPSD